MNPKEIKMLKIFEALEDNNALSQRKLSKKLNISLGLINSLIRLVLRKGFFEINAFDKNKAKYLLTPKGMTEKTILTYRYIQHCIKYYYYIRTKLKKVIEVLSIDDKKNIVIFGANELTEIACIILQDYELNLVAIIDDNKVGKKMTGVTIVKSSFLGENNYDALIVTQLDNTQVIINEIIGLGVNQNKICTI